MMVPWLMLKITIILPRALNAKDKDIIKLLLKSGADKDIKTIMAKQR